MTEVGIETINHMQDQQLAIHKIKAGIQAIQICTGNLDLTYERIII